MYTLRATINGSYHYYECETLASLEALQGVFALAKIEYFLL